MDDFSSFFQEFISFPSTGDVWRGRVASVSSPVALRALCGMECVQAPGCGFYVFDSGSGDCFVGDVDASTSAAPPASDLVTLYAEKCECVW